MLAEVAVERVWQPRTSPHPRRHAHHAAHVHGASRRHFAPLLWRAPTGMRSAEAAAVPVQAFLPGSRPRSTPSRITPRQLSVQPPPPEALATAGVTEVAVHDASGRDGAASGEAHHLGRQWRALQRPLTPPRVHLPP